jgi:hypothetical protein
MQRVGVAIFSPALPLAGMPDAIDGCALYAGDTAMCIGEVESAAATLDGLSQ